MKFKKYTGICLLLLVGLTLQSCSKSDNSPTSLIPHVQPSSENDVSALFFTGELTEEKYVKIFDYFNRDKAFEEVESLFKTPESIRASVQLFNGVFNDKRLRRDFSNFIQQIDLSSEGRTSSSLLDFFASLLQSQPFEIFMGWNGQSTSLARYFLDPKLNLTSPFAKIFSLKSFFELSQHLTDFINTKEFPEFISRMGSFLNASSANISGAVFTTDLIRKMADGSFDFIASKDLAQLARNGFFYQLHKALERTTSTYGKRFLESKYPLPLAAGDVSTQESYSSLSVLLSKLLNTSSLSVKESAHKISDFEGLMNLGYYLNRPVHSGDNYQLILSLRKFLSRMVSFFSTTTDPNEDEYQYEEDPVRNPLYEEDVIVERVKIISTYYLAVLILDLEWYDPVYSSLSDPEEKYDCIQKKVKFDLSTDPAKKESDEALLCANQLTLSEDSASISQQRRDKAFQQLDVTLKDWITTLPSNPIVTFLKKIEQDQNSSIFKEVISHYASESLSHDKLWNTIQEVVKDFKEFNKPIDKFLRAAAGDATWLDSALHEVSALRDIPSTDRHLISTILETYQFLLDIPTEKYVTPFPVEPLSAFAMALENSNSYDVLLNFIEKYQPRQTINPMDFKKHQVLLKDLLNRLVRSHLLDSTLSSAAVISKNVGFYVDGFLLDLFGDRDDTESDTLSTPFLSHFKKIALEPDFQTSFTEFLQSLANSFQSKEGINKFSHAYTELQKYNQRPLWTYIRTEENLKLIFDALAAAIDRDALNPEARHYIVRIIEKGEMKKLVSLLSELLKFSRINE
ncbi:MAG: hypothetical protein HYS98_01385 [Deltaproteobacteria bacterium]|nr:hypothetical protein [Deltaproteobacteria bacterium]